MRPGGRKDSEDLVVVVHSVATSLVDTPGISAVLERSPLKPIVKTLDGRAHCPGSVLCTLWAPHPYPLEDLNMNMKT